jgi:endonuclease/exonuclease/phosphatase family metal-dependent hydrolase
MWLGACAQWNIERGYKVDKIIQELLRLKPDIIALQEIDVGNDRSGGRDTGMFRCTPYRSQGHHPYKKNENAVADAVPK